MLVEARKQHEKLVCSHVTPFSYKRGPKKGALVHAAAVSDWDGKFLITGLLYNGFFTSFPGPGHSGLTGLDLVGDVQCISATALKYANRKGRNSAYIQVRYRPWPLTSQSVEEVGEGSLTQLSSTSVTYIPLYKRTC